MSKTISVPVDILYQAWTSDKLRNRWLKETNIVIRKATENKSARITWSDQVTSLSVDFYPKGESKAQVVVQHLKLPDPKKASHLKEFWGKTLEGDRICAIGIPLGKSALRFNLSLLCTQ